MGSKAGQGRQDGEGFRGKWVCFQVGCRGGGQLEHDEESFMHVWGGGARFFVLALVSVARSSVRAHAAASVFHGRALRAHCYGRGM